MSLTRSYQLKLLKNQLQKWILLNTQRYQTSQTATANDNTQTSQTSGEGTTHFGFQTVKESEKEQKGKLEFII